MFRIMDTIIPMDLAAGMANVAVWCCWLPTTFLG